MKEETMSLMRNTIAAAMLSALALGTHAHAAADPCKLEISGNDLMQYDKSELSAPATCKEITVTLHHTGKLPKEAMGHNWVLVSAADLVDVANAGMTAGLPNDYDPSACNRELVHTNTIACGDTMIVSC